LIRAAGILLMAPSGRALFLQRSAAGDAAGQWSFPGGKLEEGEDAATAAVRECLEETGYLVGSPGRVLCRRVADDVDYTTFVAGCDEEFTPKLDEENTAFAWVTPAEALGPIPPQPSMILPGVTPVVA
jgi:8-oxo-dGTP pyrophosphatase MutT (NUDIX family)